jgi:hypothetical protein
MEKSPTLQYCLVAKISYEPRHSSGRWCQSIRRPLWSRWLKYSVGTRIERKPNHIEKKNENVRFNNLTVCCCFTKATNKTFSTINKLHEWTHICFTTMTSYWTYFTKISNGWFKLKDKSIFISKTKDYKIFTSSDRRSANGEMERAIGICDCLISSVEFGIVYAVERIRRGLQLPWSWQTKFVPTNGGNKPGAFVMNGVWVFSWLSASTWI